MPSKPESTEALRVEIGTYAVADLLRLSRSRVVQLTHAEVLHCALDAQGRPRHGKYVLAKVVSDYIGHLRAKPGTGQPTPFEEARARRALANAAVSEMRVKQMSGETIEIKTVLETVRALVMRFRSKVQSVLPRIASEAYASPSLAEARDKADALALEIFRELRGLTEEDLQVQGLRLVDAGEET